MIFLAICGILLLLCLLVVWYAKKHKIFLMAILPNDEIYEVPKKAAPRKKPQGLWHIENITHLQRIVRYSPYCISLT